jgi:hypothetical protein
MWKDTAVVCTAVSHTSDDNFGIKNYAENIGAITGQGAGAASWYIKDHTDNADANGGWTYQKFVANDIEHGQRHSGGSNAIGCAENFVEFTYAGGGGMFVWMSWLPPVLMYGLPLFGAALLSEADKLAEWMYLLFRDYRYMLNLPIHPETGKPHVLYPAITYYEDEREWFWNSVVRRPVYNI